MSSLVERLLIASDAASVDFQQDEDNDEQAGVREMPSCSQSWVPLFALLLDLQEQHPHNPYKVKLGLCLHGFLQSLPNPKEGVGLKEGG